ncbi:MAG TPA: MFS transporter [Pyrinomonadaceae bacterium]|nr:MFS transporter [Pyrinomonadaceae bacterium]
MTTAYFGAFVGLGLSVGLLGPTIPGLAEQTHVGLSAISCVFTFRSLGYVLGAVRGGKLFDRRPGNPVMAGMLAAMALMMALVPVAPRLWLLLAVMLVLGAAEATLDVGANTLLLRVHGNRVGPFMNAMHSFFGVGALMAPIVVAQTASFKHPTAHSYFVIALLLLPLAAYTLRLPSPVALPANKHEEPPGTNHRLVFLIALFLFLYVGAEVGFAGWIFTYAVEFKLSEATTAAYLTSLFWGSLTFGRMLTIPLVARLRPRSILVSSLSGSLFSLALMLLSPRSFGAVLTGTMGLGLSMASIFPTTLTFAGRRMKMTGRVTGWLILGSSAGAMLVPFLMGQSFQSGHPRILMVVITTTLLAALAVLALVIRTSQKVTTTVT